MSRADRGLSGRVVAVTGATDPTGRVLAQSLAAMGAALGLLGHDEVATKELAATLPTESFPVPCDLRDPDSLSDALAVVAEVLGGVDSAVVGVCMPPVFCCAHDLAEHTWRQAIDVNLTSVFFAAQAAHAHLAASGRGGRLVLLSSAMAQEPRRGICAYVASKAGVEGLARALSIEWEPDDIGVNAVAPRLTETEMGISVDLDELSASVDVGGAEQSNKFGDDQELAEVVGFLAGDLAEGVTGRTLAVYGPSGRNDLR